MTYAEVIIALQAGKKARLPWWTAGRFIVLNAAGAPGHPDPLLVWTGKGCPLKSNGFVAFHEEKISVGWTIYD